MVLLTLKKIRTIINMITIIKIMKMKKNNMTYEVWKIKNLIIIWQKTQTKSS